MPKSQFTINPDVFVDIAPNGVVMLDSLRPRNARPTQGVAVHVSDLTLRLYGEGFVASATLSPADAENLVTALTQRLAERAAG